MQEDENVIDDWNLEPPSLPENSEATMDIVPDLPEKSLNVEKKLTDEEKGKIIEEFMGEWKRLNSISHEEDSYFKFVSRATQNMKRIKSGASATTAVLKVAHAFRQHSSRRGKIPVQPTSIQRRREGVTKGSKRLPAGRPCKGMVSNAKRRHILAKSVQNNVRHVTKH
jgi:hypothetical protein